MRCSQCRALLHHSKFDDNMKDNWVSVEDDAPAVVCINCLRGHCHDKRQEISKLHCDQCARRGDDIPTDWPEGAFFADDVSNWRLHKTPLKCAACKLEAGEIATEILIQLCQRCEKSVELKGPYTASVQFWCANFLKAARQCTKELASSRIVGNVLIASIPNV